ncbi:hypothetical protein [Nostoc sp. NMS9]|uniref:hypothetical protein n=1 Tax=Nostoc sp. NMS9 TaxID=2815393 RepID=UPI0025CC120D|nr:hypothetical protein [Nostoc sp. NMS9]MBN3938673.1 hypothetical protein [Nostoc sp. NMS9]
MGFLYTDITGQGTDSNKYGVSIRGISVGSVMKQGNLWFAFRPGSNIYEAKTFLDKVDAAKHLAEIAKVDWRN